MPGTYVIDVIGLTTVATALGFAALFAPSGLGVRDVLLAGGVNLLVPKPGAGELVALSARLLGLFLDFLSGVISLVLYRGVPRRRSTPAQEAG